MGSNSGLHIPADAFMRRLLGESDAEQGASEALKEIGRARRIAEAKAARLLAERECPPDLTEWGRVHGIPNFAEMTWMAGFLAGMRVAAMDEPDRPQEPRGG